MLFCSKVKRACSSNADACYPPHPNHLRRGEGTNKRRSLLKTPSPLTGEGRGVGENIAKDIFPGSVVSTHYLIKSDGYKKA